MYFIKFGIEGYIIVCIIYLPVCVLEKFMQML